MIPIPNSLTIARREDGEAWLMKKARAWVEKSSGDRSKEVLLHASDCLDPRLAYFARKFPGPVPDRLIPIFLIGRVLHAFVINAVEGTALNWDADGGSKISETLGVTYSPDMLIKGIPREIKTSRSPYEPRGVKDLSLYCEQILIYMAAEGKTQGDLWVLYMNAKDDSGTSPVFRVYKVTISKADLKATQDFIKKTTETFHKAFKEEKPRLLPLCRPFKCGPKGCQYWEQCKPEGRYPLKTRTAWPEEKARKAKEREETNGE